jgi:hypothetical protein
MSLTSSTSAPIAPRPAPATDIPVLVPWRPDGAGRDSIWQLLADEWDRPVFTAPGPLDGPFNRSAALNEAARAAGAWSTAVIADADSWVPRQQLDGAIAIAERTQQLTIAHDLWLNVEADELDDWLTTRTLRWSAKRMAVPLGVSSMLVVPRSVWDAVGGFDERFCGWGWEDRAFARACEVLTGGVQRVHGAVHHLAHERPAAESMRMYDPQYAANRTLWLTYRRAATVRQMHAALG